MRLIYQRQCPFALYGEQCKASRYDHAHYYDKTLWTRLDDYRLQCSADLPDNIEGGIIQLPDSACFFIRLVDYSDRIITVSRPVYQTYLDADGSVAIFEGCDRTILTLTVLLQYSRAATGRYRPVGTDSITMIITAGLRFCLWKTRPKETRLLRAIWKIMLSFCGIM